MNTEVERMWVSRDLRGSLMSLVFFWTSRPHFDENRGVFIAGLSLSLGSASADLFDHIKFGDCFEIKPIKLERMKGTING